MHVAAVNMKAQDVRESRSLVGDVPIVRVELALLLDMAIEVARYKMGDGADQSSLHD